MPSPSQTHRNPARRAGPLLTDELRRFHAGEKLFAACDRDPRFFVIGSGEVEIVDESGESAENLVTCHGPGEFTGDVGQLDWSAGNRQRRRPHRWRGLRGVPRRPARTPQQAPRPGRPHHAGVHRPAQLLRQVGRIHGAARDRLAHLADTFRVRDFLSENRVPYTWLDLEADPQVQQLLKQFGLSEADTPVVACGHRSLLRNPSNRSWRSARPAPAAGAGRLRPDRGRGGAGGVGRGRLRRLGGAAHARAGAPGPGGQAGRSMRIENYLGFPTGITGAELAERAVLQANKFGREAARADAGHATDLRQRLRGAAPRRRRDGDGQVPADRHRRRVSPAGRRGLRALEGRGVYYAATPSEAQLCRGSDVVVVGGGNSAGQAAVYLAGQARKVYLVVRADDLYKNMSSYLAHRIEQTPNIELLLNTEVVRMRGDGRLGEVELVNKKTGEKRTSRRRACSALSAAVPRTDWLPPEVERDAKGFVRTGAALAMSPHWAGAAALPAGDQPGGVFAAGDVPARSNSRLRGRRGSDGGSVRPRVPEGNVTNRDVGQNRAESARHLTQGIYEFLRESESAAAE